MAAVAHLPFYSTSSGEAFGYNEREGSNANAFRNRYLNQGYRGSADLGPVRFNASRAQTAASLAATQRPGSAAMRATHANASGQQTMNTMAQTQSLAQTQTVRPASAGQAMVGGQSWSRSANAPMQAPMQMQASMHVRSLPQASEAYEQPRGVYTAPLRSMGESSRAALAQQQQQQQAASVNEAPYYHGPGLAFHPPPSNSYAPPARALGNRTYEFATDDPSYAFSSSFPANGAPLPVSRPRQDEGQSIPFGRLNAEDARDVRLRMSLQSWDSFNIPPPSADAPPTYNLQGINRGQLDERVGEAGKDSVSKRLEAGAQLRYHVPGYTGWVPMQQFRHGATYGKTTRLCIAGSQIGL